MSSFLCWDSKTFVFVVSERPLKEERSENVTVRRCRIWIAPIISKTWDCPVVLIRWYSYIQFLHSRIVSFSFSYFNCSWQMPRIGFNSTGKDTKTKISSWHLHILSFSKETGVTHCNWQFFNDLLLYFNSRSIGRTWWRKFCKESNCFCKERKRGWTDDDKEHV